MFSKVNFLERLLFTKHLAIMIKSGIPITEALSSLIDSARPTKLKKVLVNVLSDIENGKSLAVALARHPRVFNQFYISLVEVGEESGTMEENLEFLSQQLAKDYNLRKKIQGALLYPAIVLIAATLMGGFISLFILPQLVDFFTSFDIDLPPTTKVLLLVANTMKNYGLFIFAGLGLALLAAYFIIRLPAVKALWHRLVLKLPIFGKLLVYEQVARFARNFGILLKSGISVSRSIEVTANTLSNLKFRNDLMEIGKALSGGKNISEALNQKKYRQFPIIVSKMIGVGEKTGKLDETLVYLGDFYEEEIDNISQNLSTILEPILLITIGLVVGFVALAIITPIYELTGSIR